jgi:hypothetical protein
VHGLNRKLRTWLKPAGIQIARRSNNSRRVIGCPLPQVAEDIGSCAAPGCGLDARMPERLLDHGERGLGLAEICPQQFEDVVCAGNHINRVFRFRRFLPTNAPSATPLRPDLSIGPVAR